MKSTKGLQKFTDSENKIRDLLKSEYVEINEFEELTSEERKDFLSKAEAQINKFEGIGRHAELAKFENCFHTVTRNQIWENNHILIIRKMATLLKEWCRMPSCTEIALETGLSRMTVHKHLNEMNTHEMYIEQMNQFKGLVPKVLMVLYKLTCEGNVSAAKLYLKTVAGSGLPKDITYSTKISEQNNYIQINKTVLSQEQVSSLSKEQIGQLERILKDK